MEKLYIDTKTLIRYHNRSLKLLTMANSSECTLINLSHMPDVDRLLANLYFILLITVLDLSLYFNLSDGIADKDV